MPHAPVIRCPVRARSAPRQLEGGASPDWARISELVAAGDTACRALLGDDPTLGRAANAAVVARQPRPHGRARPRPVLLLEPAEPLMVGGDPRTGCRRELQAELLELRGFRRLSAGRRQPPPLSDWSLRSDPYGLELRDGAGNVWARPRTVPDRRWLAAAEADGCVLVFYGAWLGVVAPRGVRDAQYGPAQRAAELDLGCSSGLVVSATVHWGP